MKIIPIMLSIFVAFTNVWDNPNWEHISTFDSFIENNLKEEQRSIFTDEFVYELLNTCAEEEVDPWLVISIMQHESSFNPDAIAYDNKHFGLMQLSEKYHLQKIYDLGSEDIFEPIANMKVGIKYIKEIREECKDFKSVRESTLVLPLETLVVMSYNQGLGNALPDYRDGKISSYAEEVIRTYQWFLQIYGPIDIEEILSDYEVPLNAQEYLKEKIS